MVAHSSGENTPNDRKSYCYSAAQRHANTKTRSARTRGRVSLHVRIQAYTFAVYGESAFTALTYNCCCCYKEVLSVLMLCTPVFIFTSGSSALLGRPRCVYRSDCRYLPCSIHFSEFIPISFTRKRTKHENTRSPPFYDTKMGADGYWACKALIPSASLIMIALRGCFLLRVDVILNHFRSFDWQVGSVFQRRSFVSI